MSAGIDHFVIDHFDGRYAFLSNFYPSPITAHGVTFPTVEHAFQAAKTHDIDERRRIASLPTPGKAKRAGRRVTLRDDWDAIRVEVMRWCIARKFEPGSDLAAQLVATGDDCELIEGNHWGDTFWGRCNGQGENWLGRILMERRAELSKR